MKRCPQCLFIYLESDTRCDFDNTPLVVVDDAEIDAATSQHTPPSKSKKLVVLTIPMVLALSLVGFLAYRVSERNVPQTADVPPQVIPLAPQATPIISRAPIQDVSTSPTPSPAAPVKPATERVVTAHSNTTIAPVSTSGPGLGKKLGGKPAILLTSGGKIDADEVWRTKDGVWYRRDGIVTLLKPGRVKAIVNQ